MSLLGGDRLAVAFPSVVQFRFSTMAEVGSFPSWLREASPAWHEAYPSCWALVVWSFGFSCFGVPAALAGEGLVIPTGPCSRGSPPPLLPLARGSSSWELGVGWVAEAAVAPCVVSSSESERCELL
ncbi:hypothetical protein Taro_026182 [Colocasia esculenta]|uniref:Uncharacterized protein n=1 Tax=Colocasia esculenta TaxID=4460 RepID=A0A843VBB0_COLES|nr:hypothetical protein [Colocasia esculenta]